MRSFNRHGSDLILPSSPDADPCMGDPVAEALWQAMRRHDWTRIRELFDPVADPDDRSFYLGVCAAAPGVGDWIAEWCRAEPGAPLPLVIRAAHLLLPERVPAEGLPPENVGLAEECLTDVLSRDPDNADAWALLVTAARAGRVDRKEALWRFERVVDLHPTHLDAHTEMLAWLGLHDGPDEAYGFARDVVTKAPAGSPLGKLIPLAHIDRWRSLPHAERGPFMAQDWVRGGLRAAADHSIRHPSYRPRPGWPATHNAFAFALVMAGEVAAAAEQFRFIGDQVTRRPWDAYHADPVRAFTELRGWAREWADFR
ncbi:hypothetical protein [Actinomadura fibrosa]|uniref:Tetratricopeptide repeat protein n=1 Tax=Actinomadura fibrosa TaxID=111802 RepID=A0ABW2XDX4_9ACTN|nr:hypothetical protein [Actinomadura fibrosa]